MVFAGYTYVMCCLLRITTTENRTLGSLEYDFFIKLRRKGHEKKKRKSWFELFKLLSSYGTWMKYIHWIFSNQTQWTWCSYWCLTSGLPSAGIVDSMNMINTLLFVYICIVVRDNSVPESEGLDSINRCVCLILGPGFRPPYITRGCQFGVHNILREEMDVHFCNIVKLLPLTVHSFLL